MVDWNGLFKWSMEYHDGTKPSEFKQMSKEDQTWLTEALKAYSFNDTDRLQEICKELGKTEHTTEDLTEMLDELQELVELHPRNNHNLCLCGGMQEILAMIFSHPDAGVRKLACSIFTAANSNNVDVQEFVAKSGALNFVKQVDNEKDLQVKEAIFQALSSFVKGPNFEGKRRLVRDFDGLAFLTQLVCTQHSLRFHKKQLQLLYDLVINDDMIFGNEPNGDKCYVRRYFTHRDDVIKKLLDNVLLSDLDQR